MGALTARLVIWLPSALLTAVAMEVWAALLHGRVWHRWLWALHRSHHRPRAGRLEANDLLSALHAPVAIAAILYGCAGAAGPLREALFGVGVGMTGFGAAYLLVHDGLVHGRLPVRALLRLRYFREIFRAHRRHHWGAFGGAPFGLFFGPAELARHRRTTRVRTRRSGRRRAPIAPR